MEVKKRKKVGGRAKGTPNRLTSDIKEKLKEVLEGELDNLQSLLSGIDPEKRVRAITELLQYILPKATAEIQEPDESKRIPSFYDLVKLQLDTMHEKDLKDTG